MTKIRYMHNTKRFSIEMRGHAGYAPCGKDIVCAGLSVLANALVYACLSAQKSGEISHLSLTQESGYVRIAFVYEKEQSIRAIADLIITCLKMLEGEYGAFVQVNRAEKMLSSKM